MVEWFLKKPGKSQASFLASLWIIMGLLLGYYKVYCHTKDHMIQVCSIILNTLVIWNKLGAEERMNKRDEKYVKIMCWDSYRMTR